ncbi:MAG: DUF456 domain-containing protein [Dysgonomonas sp.]
MLVDIILLLFGVILIIAGIVGCIVPAIPGLPLSYGGLILLQFTSRVQFSVPFLILWAIIVIIVQILDYYIPIWGTKKFGGGKYGAWGSTIGIIAGFFILPPWGIIIFPFLGAVIGELIDQKNIDVALKSGIGALVGFLGGTLIKLIIAIILAFYFFKEVVVAYL